MLQFVVEPPGFVCQRDRRQLAVDLQLGQHRLDLATDSAHRHHPMLGDGFGRPSAGHFGKDFAFSAGERGIHLVEFGLAPAAGRQGRLQHGAFRRVVDRLA